jgi:hypothetical protein
MIRRLLLALILSSDAFAGQPSAQPRSPETWDPAGRAAEAFTGQIVFSPTRITFASGKSLPLAAAGTTRFATDMGTTVTAEVYRVTTPEAVPPYGGNTLCDGKKVAFFLVWTDTKFDVRQLAPFSGPQFKVRSPDDCGRFAYGVASAPVSAPAPTQAIDPSYLGVWAPDPGACRADDRTVFRITPKELHGPEWSCAIKQASSEGGGWLVRLSCASEGNEYSLTLRWRLGPGGRLHESQKGKSSAYVRCKDSDYR